MTSSQIEIASSSPFASVLRDHNRCKQCTTTSYQNNLCIPNDDNSHSCHRIDYTDLWVHHPQWQTPNTAPAPNNIFINPHDKNDEPKVKDHHEEDKWVRAQEMVFSVDRKTHASVFKRENSPTQSETSVEMPNVGGVSSLVQKWRDFEAEANCLHSTNSPLCSTRSNSSTTFAENALCVEEPVDEPPGAPACNEEAFGEWESDRMVLSGPPSSREKDSDATESEKLRVVDIIRKLTSDNNDHAGCESLPRVRTSLDQLEQSCFSPVLSSPRIRGRHAFNNLLMQMESERHRELERLVERKAVSKFSQRGRIQALLRFRFLHRVVEARDGRHVNSTTFELNKLIPTHIRERFKPGVPNGAIRSKCSQREVVDDAASMENMLKQLGKENQRNGSVTCHKVIEDHILDAETSPTSKQHEGDLICDGVNINMQQTLLQADREKSPSADVDFMWQGTSCEADNHGLVESTGTAEPLINVNKNNHDNEEDTCHQQRNRSNHDLVADSARPDSEFENQHLIGIDSTWVTVVSHPEAGWEEVHSDYQQQEGSNRDWINEISRPRSDWEGLRQARYCEMLDPFFDNEEICVLLQRRSVSTFLSSGLRERIDQLMMSRTQQQLNVMNNLTEDGEQEQVTDEEDKGEDEDEAKQEDEERSYSDYYDEYEDESEIGQQFNEADDCLNQCHEVSDDSYQAASPLMQPSLSSNSYSQDNRPLSSFTNHHAIEMELIYDLRGQMEQLRQDMSELRRSIKSCMNMQIKLQRSVKQETAAALSHSDQKERQDSMNKILSKGRCCICCEMQVDSILYRCGHMCTCFKCAHELQWSSGKCPMCRAPILDVVRTHADS